jgi:hypothetical protein
MAPTGGKWGIDVQSLARIAAQPNRMIGANMRCVSQPVSAQAFSTKVLPLGATPGKPKKVAALGLPERERNGGFTEVATGSSGRVAEVS